jgi:hypothetical protein
VTLGFVLLVSTTEEGSARMNEDGGLGVLALMYLFWRTKQIAHQNNFADNNHMERFGN